MGSKSKTSSTTTNPYAIQQLENTQRTLGNSTYHDVDPSQIQGYMNPFASSVIDATTARNNQNQALALNDNKDAAIKAGAFDTSGLGVQNALTQGQFDLNNQQTTAGLNAANYDQASQMAQTQNAAANQYPLLIQQLLGGLAQGTQTNTTGSQSLSGLGPSLDSFSNLVKAFSGTARGGPAVGGG